MHNLFPKEPKPKVGIKPPLFDRFSNTEENEDTGEIILNRQQTIQSIIHEIKSIFNTRLSGKDSFFEKAKRSSNQKGLPIAFGLRDFHGIDPANHFDWIKIQKSCKQTIELFEPRIKKVQVTIHEFDSKKQKLNMRIRAHLNLSVFQGPINFPIDLDYGWVR